MSNNISSNNYDKNNIFAQIIRNEAKSNKIYEDDKILAFEDINKIAKTHILIIPKGEFITYHDFIANSNNDDIAYFFTKIKEIAEMLNLSEYGYKLINNNGKEGQIIDHFHVHLISNAI